MPVQGTFRLLESSIEEYLVYAACRKMEDTRSSTLGTSFPLCASLSQSFIDGLDSLYMFVDVHTHRHESMLRLFALGGLLGSEHNCRGTWRFYACPFRSPICLLNRE